MEIEEVNRDNFKITGRGKRERKEKKDLEEKNDRKTDLMLAEDEKRHWGNPEAEKKKEK